MFDFLPYNAERGCSRKEIAEIERAYTIELPPCYRRFLRKVGRDREASQLLCGSDFYYPKLLQLRSGAEELLTECHAAFSLHPKDFVFHMHQGYQFFFFRADGQSEDPPVFYYFEGWTEPRQKYSRLSDWLREFA